MFSTRQAAQRLGVTERQVQRYIHAGRLIAEQLGDHPTAPWAITDASVEQFATARAAHTPRAQHIRQVRRSTTDTQGGA